MSLSRTEVCKQIKAALKRRSGKDWSVTGGRGTAYCWLTICAPKARCTWRDVQTSSPEPPSPGAIYRGALGVTPNQYVYEEIVRRGEEPSYRHITSYEEDPWAREAAEQGRSLVFNWEVDDPGYEFGHMGPADRVELAVLLAKDRPVHCQGESVPPSGGWEEYLARAEGRPITVFARRDWD